ILDPVVRHWHRSRTGPHDYAAGGWGPAESDRMLQRHGREWRRP
nr:hypothetical protein [Actinomycetota bacterium]